MELDSSALLLIQPIIVPPSWHTAVITHYEEDPSIRTHQRPPRDCRGPGAFINPTACTASAASSDGFTAGDGDAAAGSSGHSGSNADRQRRDFAGVDGFGHERCDQRRFVRARCEARQTCDGSQADESDEPLGNPLGIDTRCGACRRDYASGHDGSGACSCGADTGARSAISGDSGRRYERQVEPDHDDGYCGSREKA